MPRGRGTNAASRGQELDRLEHKMGGAVPVRRLELVDHLEEQGIDPNEVGRLVLDAIRGGQLWILTHPGMAKIVTKQAAALAADQSLTGL